MKRRLTNRWRRFTIARFARREFQLPGNVSYVSFTFDDFPRSALVEGGGILAAHGVRGTYFVSLQCVGTDSASGRLASLDDVAAAAQDGHELGCHTFEHLDGTIDSPAAFERSIEANRAALRQARVHAPFDVFAYPLNGPTLSVKRAVSPYFRACRFGGQTFNQGAIDLNLLKAYFLDARSHRRTDEVFRMIDAVAARGGWLIIATHDIGNRPSAYGCDRKHFEAIVRRALASKARVLPMTRACRELGIAAPVHDAL